VVNSLVAFTQEYVVAIYRTLAIFHPNNSCHYETRHGKTDFGDNAKIRL